MTYYKATRPDGWDFATGTVDYAAALDSGALIQHPTSHEFSDMHPNDPITYLSMSVESGEVLLGGSWPCRLFEVEPVGDVVKRADGAYPSKRGCVALRVVRKLPPYLALGPNGEAVAALIEVARSLTNKQAGSAAWYAARDAARSVAWNVARSAALNAAHDAARDAARYAAWDAVRYAALHAAWDVARDVARYAALALLVRDLIVPEQFDVLYGPWATVMGP